MARSLRVDEPGSWYHVMNRGIARRTVFESRADVRFFLACIARAVRRDEIEVHSFCVMGTHFHLLVRSPRGRLSLAMQRIQNDYVRRFNRQRRRDGPLFRGRFSSKPVDSLDYRHVLIRYIDDNPVSARLVPTAALFPHGSARMYASRSGPPWLERSWVETTVQQVTGRPYDGRGYATVFGESFSDRLRDLVELRIACRDGGTDPLDELLAVTPGQVLSWMKRKARLADGTQPGLPVCDPTSVAEAVEGRRAACGPWSVGPGKKPIDAWIQIHAGLLVDLCGLTAAQVARRLERSESGVRVMRARHHAAVHADEHYAERVEVLIADALEVSGVRL